MCASLVPAHPPFQAEHLLGALSHRGDQSRTARVLPRNEKHFAAESLEAVGPLFCPQQMLLHPAPNILLGIQVGRKLRPVWKHLQPELRIRGLRGDRVKGKLTVNQDPDGGPVGEGLAKEADCIRKLILLLFARGISTGHQGASRGIRIPFPKVSRASRSSDRASGLPKLWFC